MQGHAVEVRLYAENPAKKFLPSTGHLHCFSIPGDIRVDTGVRRGDEVSPHYDPMLAKIIAHGENRMAAIAKLVHALQGAAVAGVEHNLGYLIGVLNHDVFHAGDYTTRIAEDVHEDVVPDQQSSFATLAALFVLREYQHAGPWGSADGFRSNLPARRRVLLRQGKVEMVVDVDADHAVVNGVTHTLAQSLQEPVSDHASAVYIRIDGHNLHAQVLRINDTLYVMCGGHTEKFIELTDDGSRYNRQSLTLGGVVSPMPGQVIAVNVRAGDKVSQGDVLVVVEAMKMEHSISAPKAGVVKQVICAAGDRVEEGVELVEFD